jgi:hypothetical protein
MPFGQVVSVSIIKDKYSGQSRGFGFGLFVCLFGACYLATEYFRHLSGIQKLVSVLLWVAMFVFLGRYFEKPISDK